MLMSELSTSTINLTIKLFHDMQLEMSHLFLTYCIISLNVTKHFIFCIQYDYDYSPSMILLSLSNTTQQLHSYVQIKTTVCKIHIHCLKKLCLFFTSKSLVAMIFIIFYIMLYCSVNRSSQSHNCSKIIITAKNYFIIYN